MYVLEYAEAANKDLKAIYNYIAEDSETRAGEFLGEMEQSILKLREFPEMHPDSRFPELRALGIRVLPFDNYLIFYTVNKNRQVVNIVRILHGSVNYRRLFN